MAAKERSPRYPSIDLGTAVTMAKSLYAREGRARVAPEVAVKAWGFTSLHGMARSRIGALKAYGLIGKEGSDIRLSERGLAIAMLPPDSQEVKAAMWAAFADPPIFDDLTLLGENGPASDDNLKHHLVSKLGFLPDAAAKLVKVYRDSKALVDEASETYPAPMASTPVAPLPQNLDYQGRSLTPSGEEHVFRTPLAKGIYAEVRITGGDVRASHIDRLTEYLTFAKRALEADSDEAPE